MRPLWVLVAFLGCGGRVPPTGRMPDEPTAHGELAGEDRVIPAYTKAELSRALISERGAEATGERIVSELEVRRARDPAAEDRWRVAVADLSVRRRFIKSLEACEASGRWCPPRLDDPPWAFDPDPPKPIDPPLEAVLRFDLASWRKIAVELHGRGCACRTIACVDTLGVAIDQLEGRPMPAVQGDELASASLTRARECLFRLRGKAVRRRAPRVE
jgi:hypothetical protein